MPLYKFEEEFRMDKFTDLFTDKKKDAADKTTEKKGAEKKTETAENTHELTINTEDLMKRLQRVSGGFGAQRSPFVIQKGDKTHVFYASNQDTGKWGLFHTTLQPFDDDKTEKVSANQKRNNIETAGDKYYILASGNINTFNIDNNKMEKIDIGYKFNRNLDGEFRQMFDEAWAGIEENYYDGDFHGTDWKKMHERYAVYLPYLNNRADLRLMLNDLLGELFSSFLGFYSNGAEETKTLRYRTMETGNVFDNDDPYKVSSVIKNSNADKVEVNVKPGDRLKSVDGVTVDEKQDRNLYFTKPSLDKELELTFSRDGKDIAVKVQPEASGDFSGDLYDDWIDHNKKIVEEKSKDRIAYVYMNNMGG